MSTLMDLAAICVVEEQVEAIFYHKRTRLGAYASALDTRHTKRYDEQAAAQLIQNRFRPR